LEVIDSRHSNALEKGCFIESNGAWSVGTTVLILSGLEVIEISIVDVNLKHGFHPTAQELELS
jgi:hypothetical protein